MWIVLLFNPFKAASYVAQAVGLFIMVYAVIDLVESFMLKTKQNNVQTAEIVVVDNPKKGYGIFITNMLEEAEN